MLNLAYLLLARKTPREQRLLSIASGEDPAREDANAIAQTVLVAVLAARVFVMLIRGC